MSIIAWIVIGIVAGWLAEKIMRGNHGLLTNLIVGVVGAILGGWLASTFFGRDISGINIETLIIATIGAVILLAILRAVRR